MIKRGLLTALCFGIGLAVTVPSAWAIALSDVINTLETPFQPGTAAEYRIFDYSAAFSQESKIASLDRLQRANGRVEVAFDYRPERIGRTVPAVKFHWQYDSPTTQRIVSNGKTMWVYLPENSQVIQSDIEQINKTDQNDPMAFLTGLGNLSRDFAIDWATPDRDADGNYVLEMTPHRASSLINKLIIIVDRYAVESYQNRGKEEPFGDPAIAPPSRENYASGKSSALSGDDQESNALWFPILSTAVYDPNGNSTIIEFSNLRINSGIPDTTFDFAIPAGVQVVRPTGKEMGF